MDEKFLGGELSGALIVKHPTNLAAILHAGYIPQFLFLSLCVSVCHSNETNNERMNKDLDEKVISIAGGVLPPPKPKQRNI